MAKLIILSETTKQMKVKAAHASRADGSKSSFNYEIVLIEALRMVAPPARRRLLFKTAIQWPGLECFQQHDGCGH